MTIDELLREASAFRSLDDFRASVERNGYVPTLRCVPLARVTEKARRNQACVNELAERLEHLGFQVWRPRRYAGKQGHTRATVPQTVLSA